MSQPLPNSALTLAALILLVPLLLPFSRSVEVPLLTGAIIGIVAILRSANQILRVPTGKLLLLALAAYVMAALLSAVDAVAPQKSWTNMLAALRFMAFAVGLLALAAQALVAGVSSKRLSRLLIPAAAAPIALWVLDALLQAATGWSLGGPADADRLSGIFGADDLKLGPLLSALSPLLLWPLLPGPRWRLGVCYLAVLTVVLLAGARAGWVSFALVSLLLAWRLARGSKRALLAWAGAALLAGVLLASAGYQLSDAFKARVDRTLAARDGQLDVALAGRLPIWHTAALMFAAHPVNGVGVRGFRHAYPEFAAADDPWVDSARGTGAAHAHQIVLELLTETGLLGLSLWLAAAGLLWRCSRRTIDDPAAHAPWVALLVLVFPLNTHLAFYSVPMGITLCWLLTLACLQSGLRAVGDAVESTLVR
ncbi:MAG: O-antigen ligase family protein [Rhodanobacteraceae bacterium]|nr:O-antigen ligase family protein [Rhodanobacteraceae bacterium]